MELGRLLRDEGITPDMIQNNRGLLVNAMKSTLRNETLLAESAIQSYATAPEYQADNNTTLSVSRPINISHLERPPVSDAMSLLGSAPPRSSGFTNTFLRRQNGSASSLDQRQNFNDGMQSLLQGMNRDGLTAESILGNGECFEFDFEEVPIDHEMISMNSRMEQLYVKSRANKRRPLNAPVEVGPVEVELMDVRQVYHKLWQQIVDARAHEMGVGRCVL